ncbi:MAG TPA: hypothetical protein VMD52_02165 [Patescibacteria group bacterium]|nr:hypothetical protein [Patescibacteria group bacterium]
MKARNSGLLKKKNHLRGEVNLMKGLFIAVAAVALLVGYAYAVPVTTEQQFTTIDTYADPTYGVSISGTQVFKSITDTTDAGITTRTTFTQTTYMKDVGGQLLANNSVGLSETKNMQSGAILAKGNTYRNYTYSGLKMTDCQSWSNGDQFKETTDGLMQTAHYDTTDSNRISFGAVDTYYSYTGTTSYGADGSGGVVATDFTDTNRYNDQNHWEGGQFVTGHTLTESDTHSLINSGWSKTSKDETFNFDGNGNLVQDGNGHFSNIVMSGNQQTFDQGVLQPEQKIVNYTYQQSLGAHGPVVYHDTTTWGPV